MKIQYASDPHLEFGMNSRYMKVYGLEPKGDILLLAGDVIYMENRRMVKDPFFDWCSNHFKETIIVPGNHEYYKDHRLWADDYTEVHTICREWLDVALKASAARYKIVLTHHCPTMRKEFDFHQVGSGLYSAFHVDMEKFIESHDIEYWIYGYTHFQAGSGTVLPSEGNGTTLLCNQLGYVELNEDQNGFRNDIVVPTVFNKSAQSIE